MRGSDGYGKKWIDIDNGPKRENVITDIEDEMGDVLFSISNIAHFLHLNPEDALRSMLGRFEKRFRHVEKRAKEDGKKLQEMPLAEMDKYWDEAKKLEKA